MIKKFCVNCGKELTGKKLKYCDDRCHYWYKQKNKTPAPIGKKHHSQRIRMDKAARKQRAGKIGVRFN